MKEYFPYCMIGFLAAAAWHFWPAGKLESILAGFGAAIWLIAAWQDAEIRRLKRTLQILKRWEDKP